MVKEQRITKLDGILLRNMIIAGANKLTANKVRIDALNVFPVPDGDTGTNMSLTAIAAAREVEKLNTDDVVAVSRAAASGALRGGRGNSGVIFSQLFRGFSKALEGFKSKAVGTTEISQAMAAAAKTAYKAVMRPQEGTMLTVARHMAEVAEKSAYGFRDVEAYLNEILDEGHIILKKTPDMLPVLKQAGVVDSGGEGLLCFFAGAIEGMRAKDARVEADGPQEQAAVVDFSALGNFSAEEITFGYCTEFFINTTDFEGKVEDDFKAYMEGMGDSIALVSDDEIVKVHIHTDNPGAVMERAMAIGALSNLKIENMRLQHQAAVGGHEQSAEGAEAKELGVAAVVSGEGFKQIFEELGVDYVIEGGQTMNPSAEDIARGINQINAKNVIVLPNNKNVILAANQAAYLCEGRNIAVIESKTLPQGIAALMNYMHEDSLENNVGAMSGALNEAATGQLTVAVRDTEMDGKAVREGDFIGILDGKIVCAHQEMDIAAKELINIMMGDGPDVLTMYIGEDAKDDSKVSESIESYIRESFGDCELDVAFGGQAVYHYIFSAE